jgi:hypothetical protein
MKAHAAPRLVIFIHNQQMPTTLIKIDPMSTVRQMPCFDRAIFQVDASPKPLHRGQQLIALGCVGGYAAKTIRNRRV